MTEIENKTSFNSTVKDILYKKNIQAMKFLRI